MVNVGNRITDVLLFIAGAMAAVAIAGWHLDVQVLRSIVPGSPTTKFNTALALLSLAVAARASSDRSSSNCYLRLIGKVSALLAIAIAGLSAGEYIFRQDLGIDELIYADPLSMGSRWPAGRPSPITILNVLLVGLAILGRFSAAARLRTPIQVCLLIAWLVALQACLYHLLGNQVTGAAVYTQMSLPTAISFGLLSAGLLLEARGSGIRGILLSPKLSGVVTRRLLAVGVIVPPLMSLIDEYGLRKGWWDADFGGVIRVLANVIVFSLLAFVTGRSLTQSENAEARTLNRLRTSVQDRDNFLSLAAHELRTPLTALKLQNQLHQKTAAKLDCDKVAERYSIYLGHTEKQLNRLITLVNDMLDTSRIDLGKMDLTYESFDLADSVRAVLAALAPIFVPNKNPVIVERLESCFGEWDRSRVEQVFTNLLTNAVKYGPADGSPVKVSLERQHEHVVFKVFNFGPGIAKEHHERIFELFERAASPNQSGFGLGLFLAREIVDRHDGRIWVESAPNEGALFSVELPLRRRSGAVTP